MQKHWIYLLHPTEKHFPGTAAWVAEVQTLLKAEASWENWDLSIIPYDDQNSFDVQPLFVRVLNRSGPVVLMEKVQRKAFESLRQKLQTRSIVLLKAVGDSSELWGALEEARRRFVSGEPFLPRKLVVAVMIVRKLRKGNYWTGKEKGYLWHEDLAKGRGVDERYAAIAYEVINDLLQHKIVVFKTSQGGRKYALNPDRKPEVHAIADDGTFYNEQLERILRRDKEELSAYLLNEPNSVKCFTISAQGIKTVEFTSAGDAVAHAHTCQECSAYEVQVCFESDRVLHETIRQKHILIQFLEAFLTT